MSFNRWMPTRWSPFLIKMRVEPVKSSVPAPDYLLIKPTTCVLIYTCTRKMNSTISTANSLFLMNAATRPDSLWVMWTATARRLCGGAKIKWSYLSAAGRWHFAKGTFAEGTEDIQRKIRDLFFLMMATKMTYMVSGGSDFRKDDQHPARQIRYINDGKGNFTLRKDALPMMIPAVQVWLSGFW